MALLGFMLAAIVVLTITTVTTQVRLSSLSQNTCERQQSYAIATRNQTLLWQHLLDRSNPSDREKDPYAVGLIVDSVKAMRSAPPSECK